MDIQAEAKAARIAISTQQDAQQKLSVLNQLVILAECRQASVSEAALTLYTRALMTHEYQDLRDVVADMSMRPVKEYEKAFPTLGDLIGEINEVKRRREENAKWKDFRLPPHIQKAIDEDRESTRRLESGEEKPYRVTNLLNRALGDPATAKREGDLSRKPFGEIIPPDSK